MNSFILSNEKHAALDKVGSKAKNLYKLIELHLEVPKFVIIPNTTLQYVLQTVNTNDINAIKSSIQSFQFQPNYFKPLQSYFSEDTLFAIRSSGIDEDGKESSFAGQFDTKLFVPFGAIGDAVKEVWLSAYSDRIKVYRQSNGLPLIGNIAVIIQEMINAESAGVAFGINPLSGKKEEKVINAVYGLGEGLVSGLLTADQYIYSETGIEKTIAEKDEKIIFNKERFEGTITQKIDPDFINAPVLSNEQIIEIVSVLDKLEDYFHHPQDIEFAFYKDKLYLLQCRPVTALRKEESNNYKVVWDNSNIIESYPGTTLPLTYSFIVKMYNAVYRQLSDVLGVSRKKIDAHSNVYANMLGLLKGRVYYNLNSWYTSLSLLPGYAVNATFMEKMMGVKEKFDFPIEKKKTTFVDYWDIVVAVFSIIKNLLSIENQRKKFQSYFNNIMNDYESIDFKNKSAAELLDLYFVFEQTLVKKWKAPLVNDFFAMVFFGLLQKQVLKLGFSEDENLHNDLISGSKDIITTEPIRITLDIAALILKDKAATKLFKTNEAHLILKLIEDEAFSQINQAIKNYIQFWGDRSVGELKLETITYRQNAENYIKVLQSYVNKDLSKNTYFNGGYSKVRKDAEIKIKVKLKGLSSRLIFNYILKKARYFVSNRENLRYQRTRGFGMVRRIYIAIGEKFAEAGLIQHARDIFYLTIDEVTNALGKHDSAVDYVLLVAQRKVEYAQFEQYHLPERIITKDITASDLVFNSSISLPDYSDCIELKGIGCCAGIVRAKIVVVHSPDEIDNLNNAILVTSSTDPGWVTLFPTCSAILVERGSLLSHSAIVSRELGIPCIVGIKNLLQIVKTGMEVELNGSTGSIKILSK